MEDEFQINTTMLNYKKVSRHKTKCKRVVCLCKLDDLRSNWEEWKDISMNLIESLSAISFWSVNRKSKTQHL